MHIYTVSLIHVPTKSLKILWGVKWNCDDKLFITLFNAWPQDWSTCWLTDRSKQCVGYSFFLFVHIFHMFTFNCRSDVIIFVRLRRSQKVKEKTHYFKVKNDVESIKVMSTELIPFCTCVVFWHRQVMLYEKD